MIGVECESRRLFYLFLATPTLASQTTQTANSERSRLALAGKRKFWTDFEITLDTVLLCVIVLYGMCKVGSI